MLKRLAMSVGVLSAIVSAGCAGGPCSTGWSFQVGKPSTVSAQTVLGPSVTTFAGQGVAAGPVGGELALIAKEVAAAAPGLLPLPSRSAAMSPLTSSSSCSLDDICKMLIAMQNQLNRIAKYQPMPGGD